MTVKARMRKPSRAPVIASDTGRVMWAAASRTTSHTISTIVRRPMMMPTPCQPLTPPDAIVCPPSSKSTSCQFKKLSIRSSTLPTSMSCSPRPSALNRSIPPVLSSSTVRRLRVSPALSLANRTDASSWRPNRELDNRDIRRRDRSLDSVGGQGGDSPIRMLGVRLHHGKVARPLLVVQRVGHARRGARGGALRTQERGRAGPAGAAARRGRGGRRRARHHRRRRARPRPRRRARARVARARLAAIRASASPRCSSWPCAR